MTQANNQATQDPSAASTTTKDSLDLFEMCDTINPVINQLELLSDVFSSDIDIQDRAKSGLFHVVDNILEKTMDISRGLDALYAPKTTRIYVELPLDAFIKEQREHIGQIILTIEITSAHGELTGRVIEKREIFKEDYEEEAQ